jgi:hypothetical protein
MSIRIAALVMTLTVAPALARAQTIAGPIKAGACTVVVQLSDPVLGGTDVELQINKKSLPRVAAEGKAEVRLALTGPLIEGDEIRARRLNPNANDNVAPGPAITVAKADALPECAPPHDDEILSDERETFEASGYVGMAIDNFAPASVGGYADSEAGGRQTRAVGGFDFEFRVAGSPTSRRQVWIFGETLHGVRSADINCADSDDKPAVCDKLTQANAGRQLQFILENATSVEAYAGVRVELATLQADSPTPAKLYATLRTGVMMVNGDARSGSQTFQANNAYRGHHFGGGLLMPAGRFAGSLLEVGWGRTDIFDSPQITNHWRRLKIDGSLNFQMLGAMYAFVQLYADFDPGGKSSDSVQTFFGLSFGIPDLLK